MTGQRTTEHGLELGDWPGSRLPDERAANGATPGAEEPRGHAVYLDTPDLRLLRRGVTVRFRPGPQPHVWTLTLPEDAPAIGPDRREISASGRLSRPPALIEDLVRGWALGTPLAEVSPERAGQPTLAPWDLATPATTAEGSAGALIQAGLVASAARLVDHLAAVVLDEDPEGVHQARVGIRRLRSDLKTAEPLLDFESVRAVRRELEWLMDELGQVRDLDVLLARLRSDARSLDLIDHPGVDVVLARALGDRAQSHGRLLTALRAPRCAVLLEKTAQLVAAPPFKGREVDRPAAEVLPGLVRGPLERVRREVRRQGRTPDDEGLHRIRISVKRVRYAAELAAPAVGRRARHAARSLAEVQRVLGDHNDACVAIARLRELGSQTGPSGAWAAGLFGGLQLTRSARCRKRFGPVWARAAGKKRWRWTER